MPESYAGIVVPEGEPEALRSAASQFAGLAGSLEGATAELQGLPGTMATWQGPASVAYAGSCMTQASGAEAGVSALQTAAAATRAFAADLEAAQEDARAAIEDARDARRRIRAAQEAIDEAQAAQAAAGARADQAAHVLAVSTAAGTPSPAAQADLDAAAAAGQEAADREARARRQLHEAQDDFERAQRRGERAEDRARDAAMAAVGAFGGPSAFPGVPGGAQAAGGPGPLSGFAGSFANGRNDGWQWWNEDQFASNVWPFHPANDSFLRGKWGVDQTVGFGSSLAEIAAFGAARAAQQLASTPITRTMLTRGAFATTVGGRIVSAGTWTSITSVTTPRPAAQVAQLTSRAGNLSRLGWVARGGGVALAGVSGAIDQWYADSGRTDLSTTDRVGRAAGVGTYMMGAAATGAVIGSVIPVGGTLAGAAVGAGVGLLAGAVANSIEPAKQFAADAGQWTANAAVDTYNAVSSGVQTGLSEAREFVEDFELPDVDIDLPDVDIDMPDLNPF